MGTLHSTTSKKGGKEMFEVMTKINQLRETNIDDVPESSRFLLEMNYDNLMK